MYPGQVARFHWGFDYPAHAKGTEEQILNEFRRVRDEIKAKFTAYGVQVRSGKLS
jgi:arsenate reductase